MAGRADAPEYGRLRALRFPRDRLIFGPLQIQNRILADPAIAQQLTLLRGGGATVTAGNLLVLPVGNSFVYVEPLFVQAAQGRIPELQRVVLATQDRVVMAESFEKALDQLFGQAPPAPTPQPTPTPQPSPGATGQPTPRPSPPPAGAIAELVKAASDHYQQAQDALRRGDFAEYGRLIKLLEDDLAKLRAATGQ
jgi:uncharacterized membrane protein (UPF0182 family)